MSKPLAGMSEVRRPARSLIAWCCPPQTATSSGWPNSDTAAVWPHPVPSQSAVHVATDEQPERDIRPEGR